MKKISTTSDTKKPINRFCYGFQDNECNNCKKNIDCKSTFRCNHTMGFCECNTDLGYTNDESKETPSCKRLQPSNYKWMDTETTVVKASDVSKLDCKKDSDCGNPSTTLCKNKLCQCKNMDGYYEKTPNTCTKARPEDYCYFKDEQDVDIFNDKCLKCAQSSNCTPYSGKAECVNNPTGNYCKCEPNYILKNVKVGNIIQPRCIYDFENSGTKTCSMQRKDIIGGSESTFKITSVLRE